MSSEEIKKECEKMYLQIKDAEDRLEELRAICKHEKTFEGNYSWRVGSIHLAEICEYCGSLIKYKDQQPISTQPISFKVMHGCDICGNKRCPHAIDKKYKCTNSNEVGQVPELS